MHCAHFFLILQALCTLTFFIAYSSRTCFLFVAPCYPLPHCSPGRWASQVAQCSIDFSSVFTYHSQGYIAPLRLFSVSSPSLRFSFLTFPLCIVTCFASSPELRIQSRIVPIPNPLSHPSCFLRYPAGGPWGGSNRVVTKLKILNESKY